MSDLNESLNESLNRPTSRRSALKVLGTGAITAMGAGLLSQVAHAQRGAGLDAAILNFALNLEYLEAEYYSYAVTGAGLEAQGISVNGSGTPGSVVIKPNPQVPFADQTVRELANELMFNETRHVLAVRNSLASSGVQPIARPAINLRESFTAAAIAAGVIAPGQTFDPFANDVNFLVGAFMFEDVGATAYKGAAPLLTNKSFIENSAGILAVEGYHASAARLLLYQAGQTARDITQKISDLRDTLDGSGDTDQGVVANGQLNAVPTDNNGIIFSRTTRQVLNIVYGAVNATSGGFFPNGVNGQIQS